MNSLKRIPLKETIVTLLKLIVFALNQNNNYLLFAEAQNISLESTSNDI